VDGRCVPLGHDVYDRRIVIDEPEAESVRYIFRRLPGARLRSAAQRRSGPALCRFQAPNLKDRNRVWWHSFSRGALYALLSNPIYVGEIRHKNLHDPGQHQAIVDRSMWERTQQQLRAHRVRAKSHNVGVEKSPLIGRLVDENGDGLTPSHARKGERKYCYYVSRNFPAQGLEPSRVGWRLPARELEDRVAAAVGEMLGDESAVLEAAQKTDVNSSQVDRVLHAREPGATAFSSLVTLRNDVPTVLRPFESIQPERWTE